MLWRGKKFSRIAKFGNEKELEWCVLPGLGTEPALRVNCSPGGKEAGGTAGTRLAYTYVYSGRNVGCGMDLFQADEILRTQKTIGKQTSISY